MILVLLVVMVCNTKGMESNPGTTLDALVHCLIAYKCTDSIDNLLAYKTGPDATICFGIITQEQRGAIKLLNCPKENIYYFLRLLTKPKLSHNFPGNLGNFARLSERPIGLRKVTDIERELVAKAIIHNGARFLGLKTDGDSLELLESSK